MSVKYLLFLIICINLILLDNCNDKYINPNAYYRIDSLYNGYSITIKNGKVNMSNSKKGDCQNFIFRPIEGNSYYIESRKDNNRLGVNDNNEIVLYNKNDKEGNEGMIWNVNLYEEKININHTQFSIQNKHSLNFLEIKEFNETSCQLTCTQKDFKKSVYFQAVFKLVKIFEVIDIKPEHLKIIENEPIDIVIKYIDLTDKNLNREGIPQVKKDQDNEELKYSVRSIFKHVPWVRKIFIIMPNEKVRYFKPIEEIKDKFVYVKDKDLVGFDSSNSAIFQFNMFRLKKYNLSENFIYMDDDYFFGRDLKKSDFFYYDEDLKKVLPFVISFEYKEIDINEDDDYYNLLFENRKKIDPHSFFAWKLSVLASEKLLYENYDVRPMITTYFTHCAIPVNIHDVEECYELILKRYKYIEETLYSLERHILILQSEHLFVLYGLNIKKRKVHFVWFNYLVLSDVKISYLYAPLYVINTDGNSIYTEEHYKNEKIILEQRYPERTKYELPYDVPVEKEQEPQGEGKKTEEPKTDEKDKEKDEKSDKVKKQEKIDFNLTYNEFYMETVNEQKKKELEIKYKKIIKDYKKCNWYLFLLFILLSGIMMIIIIYSKIKKN